MSRSDVEDQCCRTCPTPSSYCSPAWTSTGRSTWCCATSTTPAQGRGRAGAAAEAARLRTARRIYADGGIRPDDYEKLDVEPSYLERGGTVLRLAMIYGEHDHQRREEFVLRRVRAGRTASRSAPVRGCGPGAYVGDVAAAVLACLGTRP